eukprot:1126902-Amphidinium_carterae.1
MPLVPFASSDHPHNNQLRVTWTTSATSFRQQWHTGWFNQCSSIVSSSPSPRQGLYDSCQEHTP